ncbi:MAG TPA: A/G-specific adenine glycosylase [Rubrobacter sp.]|nr:A/G-specific adenine glycosylase [Rubrobacter sp.]
MREALLSWFEENARDLPWRRTRDPWRILVSEVMLQQIQVKRAIPFYERFLARFPTVEALARAPLSDAIRVWGDLGRYRRVVNLHRTARIVVDDHGGNVPSDPDVLLELPGIGPYTAGAVACFAYERDVPFFDTNMHRVLHRAFFGPDVPAATAKPKEVMELAAGLLPSGRGWAWNQAVMEFGALRCTARRPACEGCPLHDHCKARPKMARALAGAPRAKRNGPVPRYEETNIYLRGRVLARLREAPAPGVTIPDLALQIGGATDVEPRRLREVVEGLERDGLLRVTDASERPEAYPAGAVAEERASYSAGPEREDPAETRVSLP